MFHRPEFVHRRTALLGRTLSGSSIFEPEPTETKMLLPSLEIATSGVVVIAGAVLIGRSANFCAGPVASSMRPALIRQADQLIRVPL